MPPRRPPPPTRQPRALAYARVSTEEQVTSGISLDAQRAALTAYCTLRGFELLDTVTDPGVSAAKPLASREGGRRVLELVQSGAVQAVVAYKLDRLFRDCADCLLVTRGWDERQVSLHLVDLGGQAIDTASAMGRFFLSVMAAAAELERNLVGERTSAALAHLKSTGVRLGAEGLGWRRDEALDDAGRRRVLPVDAEWATVARIVALRRSGLTLRDIAQQLTQEGHPTKRGGRWHASTVRAVTERLLHEAAA
jgi:DNA invertase Pin-like site-specific DNA recombinase